MATVKAFIRTSTKKKENLEVNVRFRLSDGRSKQLFHKSEILINPNLWDSKKESIKPKALCKSSERIIFNRSIDIRKDLLIEVYDKVKDKEKLTSKEFEELIDMKLHPNNYDIETDPLNRDFFYQFGIFLKVKDYMPSDKKNYQTLMRFLKRFELYQSIKRGEVFELKFEEMTVDTVRDIERFLRDEHLYVTRTVYKVIYKELPESRMPGVRGDNTIWKIMKRFRTFVRWAIAEGLIINDPFIGYEMKSAKYGTPYYISIEERNLM